LFLPGTRLSASEQHHYLNFVINVPRYGVDTLQADRDMPVLDRRLAGPPFHNRIIEHMRRLKRRSVILPESDGINSHFQYNRGGIRVRSP
jgi:hypothetical protein